MCIYDPDLETYKLTSLRKLKDTEREKLTVSNRRLNEQLQKLSAALLQLKSKSLPLTTENLRSSYLAPPKGPVPENKILLDWYNEFIATKEKEIGSGINGYRSTFEYLKAFTAKNGLFDFSDLTKQFLESFRDYFVDKGLAGSTVHKQFRNLRIFLNWVMAQDENDSIAIPSAYKKFKVKARYGDPIGLTVDQFFQFYKLDLSKRKALEVTRDVFAFAVSIGGPRYVDVNKDSLAQANKQWDGLLDSILAATANHVTTVSMEELIFAD